MRTDKAGNRIQPARGLHPTFAPVGGWLVLSLLAGAIAFAGPAPVEEGQAVSSFSGGSVGASADASGLPARGSLELRGLFIHGEAIRFSLFDPESGERLWLGLGERSDGYWAKTYDPARRQLTVEVGGTEVVLELEAATIGAHDGSAGSADPGRLPEPVFPRVSPSEPVPPWALELRSVALTGGLDAEVARDELKEAGFSKLFVQGSVFAGPLAFAGEADETGVNSAETSVDRVQSDRPKKDVLGRVNRVNSSLLKEELEFASSP